MAGKKSKITDTGAAAKPEKKAAKTIKKKAKTDNKVTAKKKTGGAAGTAGGPLKKAKRRVKRMKVLYAVSEAFPFAKTGGLGDVAGSLPKALAQAGAEVCVVLPYYSAIEGEWSGKLRYVLTTDVSLGWRRQRCDVYKLRRDGVTYYFIGNDYYFKRQNLYGFYDDGERFTFFSKAVLDIMPLLDYFPDIIHLNDWQTAMIAIYLKRVYNTDPRYAMIKTLFTIHNIQYQGHVDKDFPEFVAGIDPSRYADGVLDYEDGISLMKGAVMLSDYVTTVSPRYAREIQTPEHSCRLDYTLRYVNQKLCGILNGIDMKEADPATDPRIFRNYTLETAEDKKLNKTRLQSAAGLTQDENKPLLAVISRLADHKGFDLLLATLNDIMVLDIQLIVLGKGEWDYEQRLLEFAADYRGRISVNLIFSQELAAQIYAGADMLLVPSKSEPCGLTQMFAMRYGTVPIVRNVGGLSDTVRDCYADPEHGNGFSFDDYTGPALWDAVHRAVETYKDKERWKELMKRGMESDFSWARSAEQYMDKYRFLTGKE